MCQNDHTDTELAYWIKKCLLFRGTRSFALLVTEGGFSSLDVRVAAVGQDRIGWTDFLHGKVSIEIASIQKFHCMSSPACRLTGNDWMKAIICPTPSGFSVTTLCTATNLLHQRSHHVDKACAAQKHQPDTNLTQLRLRLILHLTRGIASLIKAQPLLKLNSTICRSCIFNLLPGSYIT